jgi:hypothetical protein
MRNETLTGTWKGYYTYGWSYPLRFWFKKDVFEFQLEEKEGRFSGICIDPVVTEVKGNSCTVDGIIQGTYISFKKRYKYHYDVDGNDMSRISSLKSDGVDYKGQLKMGLFSRKTFYAGKWKIEMIFKTDEGKEIASTASGTWKMWKA